MKTLKLISVISVIATIFSGCKGDTGPAGPAGSNGVANISSNIYSITPGTWSNPSSGIYEVNIADGDITSSNTDGLEAFLEIGTTWFGLPASSLLSSGDNVEYAYQNGQVTLIYLYTSAPTSTVNLKVVVIPPAIMKRHPNTNWHDYSQVNAVVNSEHTISN